MKLVDKERVILRVVNYGYPGAWLVEVGWIAYCRNVILVELRHR